MVQLHPVIQSQLANKRFGLIKIALLWEFPSLLTVLFVLGRSKVPKAHQAPWLF